MQKWVSNAASANLDGPRAYQATISHDGGRLADGRPPSSLPPPLPGLSRSTLCSHPRRRPNPPARRTDHSLHCPCPEDARHPLLAKHAVRGRDCWPLAPCTPMHRPLNLVVSTHPREMRLESWSRCALDARRVLPSESSFRRHSRTHRLTKRVAFVRLFPWNNSK